MKTTVLQVVISYAKRMEKDPDLALTVPEEWDFRGVRECDLQDAVRYEYQRENADLRKRWSALLSSRHSGATVRQHLARKGKLPDALWTSGNVAFDLLSLSMHHPLFPIPWLAMELAGVVTESDASAVRISPISELTPFFLSTMKTEGRGYFMAADFGKVPVATLVKDFEKWAFAEGRKFKSRRGKASSLPWQKLKWLAALRLHKAGLGYEAAQTFITGHARKVRVDNPADVLPVFASKGSWHDAVKSAQNLIG